MAQFVIENSGSLQDTHEQVKKKESKASREIIFFFPLIISQVLRIHGNLSKSFFHWKVRLLLGAAIGGLFGIAYLVSKKVGTTKRQFKDQVNKDQYTKQSSKMSGIFLAETFFT